MFVIVGCGNRNVNVAIDNFIILYLQIEQKGGLLNIYSYFVDLPPSANPAITAVIATFCFRV